MSQMNVDVADGFESSVHICVHLWLTKSDRAV